ncbi:hypothetical protein KAI30_00540, partial [Candidatus Bathyarchaeota archaeon]|nr:hypothetical protein [Candidatus Bathyarchaeota archaeon]
SGLYEIRWDGESVKNGRAVGITVNTTFIVPPSTEGDHNVTLYDVTNATESLPTPFTVLKLSTQIQTVNLANETLANILVEVYNATTDNRLDSKITNATGWTVFPLDLGNYSFKAFWKDVEVGVLNNQVIDENKTLTLKCQLANVEVMVKDEAGAPLPLINVIMIYNRTTRNNATFLESTSSETNDTGIAELANMFTTANHTLESRRYGFVFNTTFIQELPDQPRYNITCPTYTMSVEVLDSKEKPLSNVQVNLMEWSSWNSVDSATTDNQGNVNFSSTFGRYKVKVYSDSAVLGHEVVLNETMFDLIDPDGLSITIHSKISNVDLSVGTIGYFGQPVPNAVVEIERKIEQEWIKIG